MAQGSAKGSINTTNLGYAASPTNGIVTSDTGNDATIPLADGTNAGLLKPADFTKLSNTSGTNTGDQDLSTLVPYTGATTDVDLGTHILNSQALHVKGTAGNGHLALKHQSSDATASASETAFFANSNGDLKYKNDGNYYTTLKTSTNTADRVYTFPNRTGTLADDTDLAGKEPTISSGTTSQYYRGDKSWQTLDKTAVGLGNVDNTSDVNKPISTAQASSIATKADKNNTILTSYLEIPQQTAPSTPTTALRLFSDSSNRLSWKGTNGYVRTFDGTSNTADRVYTLPNASGTIALTSDIPTASIIPTFSPNETFRGVQYANNSTTETTNGGITIATTGSATARSVATTNFATKQIRKGFVGSVVSSGRYTGTRGSALLWYVGGGFRYVCDFYISDTAYAAGCRQFYGLMGQTTDLTYSDVTTVASQLNIIGVGSDTDANLQIFYNDGTGTASKIDLGANFPANRSAGSALTTMYSLVLYNAPSSNNVLYRVVNNETGQSTEGTLTTDLPANTQGLNFVASRCMGGGGGTTNSGQFDLSILGVYSII